MGEAKEQGVALHDVLNSSLDRLVHPRVRLLGRSLSAFHVFGVTGLAFAILLSMSLIAARDLSPLVMLAIIVEALATFLTLAMVTKMIAAEERLIYYHHEIAVMLVTALFLKLLGQPVLPYLEITLLGVGTFMAFGRVGCLMVGCCHGGPNRWGVCYRNEHALEGFPPYLVGVRLFPVQAVESLMAFIIVFVGSVFVLAGRPPGTAFAWYVVAYGVGRFCLEFVRGDPVRPRLWVFSEAQWTSLVLMLLVAWAELSGTLPLQAWHIVAIAALAVVMAAGVAVTATGRSALAARYKLMDPRHVRELAGALEMVSPDAAGIDKPDAHAAGDVAVGRTSLGVQVSAGRVDDKTGPVYHYTISSQDGHMTQEAASTLTYLILLLKHPNGSARIVGARDGMFHLLIQPGA